MREWVRGEGIKKYEQLQNSHGDVKYSIGKGVAKEITHMDVNKGGGIA